MAYEIDLNDEETAAMNAVWEKLSSESGPDEVLGEEETPVVAGLDEPQPEVKTAPVVPRVKPSPFAQRHKSFRIQ